MSTPGLYLETEYLINSSSRIISTREPNPRHGPAFILVRSQSDCRWALRADLPQELAEKLNRLAADELPVRDYREPPVHAEEYTSLVGGVVESGPAFMFPDTIPGPFDVTPVNEFNVLNRHFRGWTADEIPGRTPIFAVLVDGFAVSACFCARLSGHAAEAGLETAEPFRGRGFGVKVTAAWAFTVRATERVPLYATSWNNRASLAVARKLGLITYAGTWSITR